MPLSTNDAPASRVREGGSAAAAGPSGPLRGIRVIEFCQVMAGPFCGQMLADLGADVIKVEKPAGDDTRRMGPPFVAGEAAAFLAVNRNKRSVVLDVKRPEGREVMERLVASADVFIENLRPGTCDRLGLGYERLSSINPRLVYCSISGFGQTGPYRDRGGFDLVAQAMSGLMSVTGPTDGALVKVGVPVTDLTAGLLGAYGVVAALLERAASGRGQHVDTSLLEAGIAYTVWESASYFATGEVPQPTGTAHRLTAPYQAFPTRDGHVIVGGANQANWERICRALERPDLVDDERFRTPADRMRNREELVALLEEIFRARTTGEWLERLAREGVPSGPVYDLAQVYADPHVEAREMVVSRSHPVAGDVRMIGVPVKLSRTPGAVHRPAPMLGEHTAEVLAELGFDAGRIRALASAGVTAPAGAGG
ncbi:MAG TPA: CoA transferase [Bacillota bacterium]